MNNRIKLLADHAKAYANQCTKDIDGDVSWHWMEYYTEKFAELIVQECIEAIQNESMNSDDDWERGLRIAEGAIQKHFGVEE